MTAWGPLNYLLGAVLTLGTLALWHSWRDRPVWVRLLEQIAAVSSRISYSRRRAI